MSPAKDLAEYPLFTGQISRWLWRIYTQRLTRAGRWFMIVSGVFVAYGGVSLILQGYVIAFYTAAIWFAAILGLMLYRPSVALSAHCSSRVCAGETLPVDLRITQHSRIRAADLTVIPHRLPLAIDASPSEGRALSDLSRGETASVRLGLVCNRRGSFTLRGFRVESSFPFGILRSRRTFLEHRPLLVYPKFSPLARLNLPTGRRYQPGGVALASELGESFEYLGNREYREGDNVRDIDWRATARVQIPIVREWVEEYMLRVAVVLDTHVPNRARPERADAFERAVSVTAAVSDYMARQDYLVDLFAAGPNLYHLTAGRSLAYLDQILDILACVSANPDEPFDVIEPRLAELLSRISTVICVFLDWTDARRAFVHRMHEQGVGVKVVIVRDDPTSVTTEHDAELFGQMPVIGREEFERGVDEL